MKYFILLIILIILLIILKQKEGFQVYKNILAKELPYLIDDKSYVYLQNYQCLDYEDIRI